MELQKFVTQEIHDCIMDKCDERELELDDLLEQMMIEYPDHLKEKVKNFLAEMGNVGAPEVSEEELRKRLFDEIRAMEEHRSKNNKSHRALRRL